VTASASTATFGQRVAFGFFRAFAWWLGVLPYRAALASVWPFAALAWACAAGLRRRTGRRIQSVFPEKTPRERRRIAWVAWRNLVFTGVDSLRIPRLDADWISRHVDTPELDRIRRVQEAGTGVVIAVPHLGSWELAGLALATRGFPFYVMFRAQRNPLINDWLLRSRGTFGLEIIEQRSRRAATVARDVKKNNAVFVVLPDIRAKERTGIPVEFLGAETLFPCAPAHCAREAACPVITAEVIRIGWTRHAWRATGEIAPDPANARDEDAKRITRYVAEKFDGSVRAHPECYFWFNSRWVLPGEEKKKKSKKNGKEPA
jgi:KDO2-lipid IV(A) lauroyltransferase